MALAAIGSFAWSAAGRGEVGRACFVGSVPFTLANHLYEADFQGRIVGSWQIPANPNPAEPFRVARDFDVDATGRTHVFNGTWYPVLSTADPSLVSWSEHSESGWNLWPFVYGGGVAAWNQRVFVVDNALQDPGGLAYFDFSSEPPSFGRAAGSEYFDFTDVTLGLDGVLYALDPPNAVWAYDPASLALLRQFSLHPGGVGFVVGIAVDADGSLFAVGRDYGELYRFLPNGELAQQTQAPVSVIDIELAPDGAVVMGGGSGEIVVTDRSLAEFEVLTPLGRPDPPAAVFVGRPEALPCPPAVLEVPAMSGVGRTALTGLLAGCALVALRWLRARRRV